MFPAPFIESPDTGLNAYQWGLIRILPVTELLRKQAKCDCYINSPCIAGRALTFALGDFWKTGF